MDKYCNNGMVNVKSVRERIIGIALKFVVEQCYCAYTPQVGLEEHLKLKFCEEGLIQEILLG